MLGKWVVVLAERGLDRVDGEAAPASSDQRSCEYDHRFAVVGMVGGYFLQVGDHRFLRVGFGGHFRRVEKPLRLGIELGGAHVLSRLSESYRGFSGTACVRVELGGFRVLAGA